MLQPQNPPNPRTFEWACQALSATGEPCDTSATCHCGIVESGSARSTPKTKRGIAALSSQVKRVVKDNNWIGNSAHC